MALHEQVLSVMARRAANGGPPPETDAPLEERRAAFVGTWREPGPEMHSVKNLSIAGLEADIPVRIYQPNASQGLPITIMFHGGGFVFGDVDSYDGYARRIANGVGCVVVNVGYRRAPEHPFPAAPEDAYAAVVWAAKNSATIGGDPTRLAVAGDSAGANLSTVTAMMCRDRGGPSLKAQILICPTVQPGFEPSNVPEGTPPIGKDWWWWQYLQDESDPTNPYAAPLIAKNLSDLPPALIITAEYDELCEEGEAYAQRLSSAGIPVEIIRYDGMWHIFHMYPSYIDAASDALETQIRTLRAAFDLDKRIL
jgi:acetyl esterase